MWTSDRRDRTSEKLKLFMQGFNLNKASHLLSIFLQTVALG